MDEKLMTKLREIGKGVDLLDKSTLTNKYSVDETNIKYISYIEKELKDIGFLELDNDLKTVYLYTQANYKAILKKISYADYENLYDNSILLKTYKNFEDFLINNYIERISAYREAIILSKKSNKLSIYYISQIYVNLANVYMEMGRIVEAINELKNVDDLVDFFPMAKANLAIKHVSLAKRITDKSIMKLLIERGLARLEEVTTNATPEEIPLDILDQFHNSERYMENILDQYLVDVETWEDTNDVSDDYKTWSVNRNLTLNYVNIFYSQGNVDDLQMIDMGLGYFKEENKMEFYSWFNTIKQEYNMARYFLYQLDCLKDDSLIHESQRYNVLINTLDYPAVGYRTELLKTSLKTAYSVLDKIGLFCCKFHNQSLPIHRVDFHKWYQHIELDIALRSPFNALYWLSKDLDFKNGEMKVLRQLRNCIEHRFIRVLDCYDKSIEEELDDKNKFEYMVSFSDLEVAAYETLKLVRSAIFYMANGFNIEYNKVYYQKHSKKVFIPLLLSVYEDDWKN